MTHADARVVVTEDGRMLVCSCPRDEEGAIDRGFIERRDEYGHVIARDWYLLVHPGCPVHGESK